MRNLILLAIIFAPARVFAEQYLCVAEKTAGFKYSEAQKSWVSADFKPDSQYTLSNSPGKYILRTAGFDESLATCGGFNQAGVIFCDGWVSFEFYKESGRFIESSHGSYHLVGNEFHPKDTENVPNPSITIGKCTVF